MMGNDKSDTAIEELRGLKKAMASFPVIDGFGNILQLWSR